MINNVTKNQKYFLNDVPNEVIRYVIIPYTGYAPNVLRISKKLMSFPTLIYEITFKTFMRTEQ